MGLSFTGDLNWPETVLFISIFYLFFNKRPLIVINKTEINHIKRDSDD
jgi:hypothetical protein